MSDNKPLEIILCTYNGEKFISEQLDSILNQTHKGMHIDIIDDASNDGTWDCLTESQRTHPDLITIMRREKNTGSAKSNFLNAIVETDSRYDYYLLSDQDDIWNNDKVYLLQKTISELELKYGNAVPILVCSDASLIDGEGKHISDSFVKYSGLRPDKTSLGKLLLQNQYPGASFIFNKALKEKMNVVPKNAVMHDQWIALYARCFGIIHFVDQPLYRYRQHSNNSVGARTSSILVQFRNRMGFGKKNINSMNELAKEYFRDTVKQAKEFLEINEKELSGEQKKIILEYCRLESLNKIKRLQKILKYDFTYNTFYRTIGEWILS